MKSGNLHTTLRLFKQNFKFSSAHFLIFDKKRAEMLQGHNYQVRVNLKTSTSKHLESRAPGYIVDFSEVKKQIKDKLDQWDEHVLLPALNAEMKFEENSQSLNVYFRDRHYVFPKNEVLLLSVTNTSVEQLSALLAKEFSVQAFQWGFESIEVEVEETQGQSASSIINNN